MVLGICFDSDIKCQPEESIYNYFRFVSDKSIFERTIIYTILNKSFC